MGSLDIYPEPTWKCLQEMLKDRAELGPLNHLLFYSLGNTSTPRKIPCSKLYAQAKRISFIIQRLEGFEEGDPVVIHLNDHWDTILWFWAVLLADGLPTISPPFSNVSHHRQEHIKAISTLLESPICITRAESLYLFDDSNAMRLYTIELLLGDNILSDGIPLPPVQGNYSDTGRRIYNGDKLEAPAILMFTSGSTGSVKAVRLTHKQVLAAVTGKASVRPLPPRRPFLNWIALDHAASLVEIHIQAMWLGVDQVHLHAADVVSSPRTFLDLLSRHRVCRSFAPNFFLAKLVTVVQSTNADAWDFSNLLVLATGGEPNDVKTCIAACGLLEKYGAPRNVITPGFGMTETCAGAIFNLKCPDYDIENGCTVASLGKCMEGIEMRVTVNDDSASEGIGATCLALPKEPGNLEVRGEVVFDGYYCNPKASAEAFTPDGWFRTGDQATIDSAGNLSLIGRIKDVFNINGVKMAAADIQSSIEQTLGIRVARLVCFPSRGAATEQITVAYVPKEWPMSIEDTTEVYNLTVQACIISTGGASRPFVFSIREQSLYLIPTTTLGKVSRAKMRSLFEAGVFDEDVNFHHQVLEAGKPKRKRTNSIQDKACRKRQRVNEAEACLIADFKETLGTMANAASNTVEVDVDIDIDTPIFDLGCTSMDLIRLKHRIDTRLGITVPIVTLMTHPTAGSLAAALDHLLPVVNSKIPDNDHDYDPVVTLRASGTKTPLWLVHPGVGEVLVFVRLAQNLADNNRPVYALRARGFEQGQARFGSISEAVDTYVNAIRSRQPQGPYALAGYSYGTMLAFEVAKKLETDISSRSSNSDGNVRFFGSFNLPPHIKLRMRQLNWNMCLLHLTYFLGLTTEAYAESDGGESFRTMSRCEALARILSVANSGRMQELGLGEESLARWVDVAYGLQSMAVDYEPEGKVGVIDVFHAMPLTIAAASREEWVRDHLSRWNDFCTTEPRLHEVGGAHYTMIGPDHVLGFATKLKAALEARGV